jgi:hypothetical protein
MQRANWIRFAATAAVALAVTPALANTGVTVESVNDYSATYGVHNWDLFNSVANGNGFQSTITSNHVFTTGLNYSDSSVYDTDFVDREKSGVVTDADFLNFDRSTDAISYFTGHGVNQLGSGTCNTSADCTAIPAGSNQVGVCRASPTNNKYCIYTSPRLLITSSSSDKRGHFVSYGNGQTAFGEGVYGNFWGAGTNGGTNLVVLDISHGVTAPFWNQEVAPALAGVHLLATIMPINGDTANVATRGSTFANKYIVNPLGSVATAWMDTLNSLPQNVSGPCATADYSYGGGHGINGCGCNFIMAVDSTTARTQWHITTETWNQLFNDLNDAAGHHYSSYTAVCNYDSVTYPWTL